MLGIVNVLIRYLADLGNARPEDATLDDAIAGSDPVAQTCGLSALTVGGLAAKLLAKFLVVTGLVKVLQRLGLVGRYEDGVRVG